MKVLVTGGNGQLGSELKDATHKLDWETRFIDIEDLDLTDTAKVSDYLNKFKPDYIINCAAYTAVDRAESDKDNAMAINAHMPGFLSKLSASLNSRLIHISTDYVYSGKDFSPIKETTPEAPDSVYGKTKLVGEQLVLQNSKSIIIRTSWLYSKYGHNFVKSMIRLGMEKDQLGVVFDQVGSPTNAEDLAEAIIKIITYSNAENIWVDGIYNYSNEGVTSWYDFACEIMELKGLYCRINPIESKDYPLPAPRPHYSVMNKNKIKNTFNIEIPYWRDTLKKVLEVL